MTQFAANMSNSGAYTLVFDIDEQAGRWATTVRKNSGSGYWTANPENWSVTVGPRTWSGTWTFDFRNTSQISFGSGSWTRPVLTSTWGASAYVAMGSALGSATAGGNIIVPGSATAPQSPTMLAPDQITANSMRARFTSRGNGGTAVNARQIQYAQNTGFTSDLHTLNGNSVVATGLSPATTYYFRGRERNAVGWSGWSNTTSGKTLSGAYYSDGSKWRPCEVYVSTGTAWRLAEVNVSTGTAWRPAG